MDTGKDNSGSVLNSPTADSQSEEMNQLYVKPSDIQFCKELALSHFSFDCFQSLGKYKRMIIKKLMRQKI